MRSFTEDHAHGSLPPLLAMYHADAALRSQLTPRTILARRLDHGPSIKGQIKGLATALQICKGNHAALVH